MFSIEKPLNPTRTLIIAGFCDSQELEEYKNSVYNSEKMVEYYTIPHHNVLFLVFYDLRESVKFYSNFKHEELGISYSISKHELPKRNEECTEKHLQGSVIFFFKNIDVKIEDNFVINFLKQYGEIKALKYSSTYQKTIEFFDIRDARKAFNALNGSPFGTGEISCFWAWDIPVGSRVEYIRLADELIRQGGSEASPKRARIEIKSDAKVEASSKKNMFVAAFDKFIVENIMEIEKMFR
ncbi:uncharacterized protein VICG_01412 [Vittaforma corneae ATCC 50505]|uniref:RRM domain-containing protein n=1 Tax=Vittaforma corneae (strain ATCC 50505) TaxID=993615 RepID=L2GKY8_VITCO|nr:uncharacterized protein VICG_01412 [Vittaforma corneae ATCC 50505]ELA41548.1 hypothetical protein VICG_01412 [Vittaforma corneae ATCC 50505]